MTSRTLSKEVIEMGINEEAALLMKNVMFAYYKDLTIKLDNVVDVNITASEQASLEMISLAIILRELERRALDE